MILNGHAGHGNSLHNMQIVYFVFYSVMDLQNHGGYRKTVHTMQQKCSFCDGLVWSWRARTVNIIQNTLLCYSMTVWQIPAGHGDNVNTMQNAIFCYYVMVLNGHGGHGDTINTM